MPVPPPPSRCAFIHSTFRVDKLRDLAHLDRGALQAIRLSGRLRVGGQTFCVALRHADGKPQYLVTSRAPQCAPTKDAACQQALDELAQSIGKRLTSRHLRLNQAGRDFRFHEHFSDLCRAFSISADLNVGVFRHFLAECEAGTQVTIAGKAYWVHVEPGSNGLVDATATLTPVGPSGRFERFIEALKNLLFVAAGLDSARVAPGPDSAAAAARQLTGALRRFHATQRLAAQPPESAQAGRKRVQRALDAVKLAGTFARGAAVNLTGANLAGADLSGLDLSGAILLQTDLTGAQLRHARLRAAQLTGAILNGAELAKAYLGKADLTDAQLVGATLRRANLERTRLVRTVLDTADLTRAWLSHGELVDTLLRGATLDETQFAHCDLSRADLRGAQGRETVFSHCEATQVSLEGARLDFPAFRHGNWSGCRFAGATLRRPMFDFTDLQHADFSGVHMAEAHFSDIFVGTGECLPTLDWTGIHALRLAVRKKDRDELRQLLDGNGVPAMLQKAPERLRTQAIRSYVTAMVGVHEFSPVAMRDLFEWAATQPPSHLGPEAVDMLVDPYRSRLEQYRDSLLPWPAIATHLPRYLRAAVMLLNGPDGAHWAHQHAVVVLQLQLLARRNDVPPDAAQWADRLRTAYRAHLPPGLVRAVVSIADDNDGDDDGVPLLAPDRSYALLVSHDYYVGLIRNEPQAVEHHVPQWIEVYRLAPPSSAAPADAYSCGLVKDVARDLAPWPLLATTYGEHRIAGWQDALLAVVPVGQYKGDFEAVFRSGAAPRKLVEEHQDRLRESFGPVLRDGESGIVMTPEHRQALLDTMPAIAGDAACEGYFLLCLAAMFARLSSWRYFGDHDDGPWALRAYAAALWRAAVQRKAEAANDGYTFATVPRAYGAPWTAEALTTNMCTDLLSRDMVPELKWLAQRNERYGDILANVWVPQLND